MNFSNVRPVIYSGSAEAQDNVIVGSQQNRQPIKSFLDTKPLVCFALSGSQSETVATVRREKSFKQDQEPRGQKLRITEVIKWKKKTTVGKVTS